MPQKPSPAIRVIPENAMLHFAVTQRQYIALLASIKFFSQKLNDPKQRETALSAFAAISTPTGFSLPSEEVEESQVPGVVPAPNAPTLPANQPKGLAALGTRKK